MQNLPWVQWFTSDWLNSSARVNLTLEERAVYLDLLFQIWEHGGAIPNDPIKLMKLAMILLHEFELVWPAVSKYLVAHPDKPGMLTHLKMLALIQSQAKLQEAGRKGGIASAATRKFKMSQTGNGFPTVSQRFSNNSETESESQSET